MPLGNDRRQILKRRADRALAAFDTFEFVAVVSQSLQALRHRWRRPRRRCRRHRGRNDRSTSIGRRRRGGSSSEATGKFFVVVDGHRGEVCWFRSSPGALRADSIGSRRLEYRSDARFAMAAGLGVGQCPGGEIGRRSRFRSCRRKVWGFDSLPGHHQAVQGSPKKSRQPASVRVFCCLDVRQGAT
jgi:hypothetical protein